MEHGHITTPDRLFQQAVLFEVLRAVEKLAASARFEEPYAAILPERAESFRNRGHRATYRRQVKILKTVGKQLSLDGDKL